MTSRRDGTGVGAIPVVQYLRVSSSRQIDGASLDVQRNVNQAYAERRGFNIVQTFVEPGVSGASFDRPAYQAMKEFVRSHPDVKGILVYNVRRFGRDDIFSAGMEIKEIQVRGLLLAFSEKSYELGADEPLEGNIVLGFDVLLAGKDNVDKSVTVSRNMEHHARQGHWQNQPPMGYRTVPCDSPELPEEYRCCGRGRKLLPSDKADIIAEIARRFDAGQIYADIYRWLSKEHGIEADPWWIRRRLNNPAYAGHVVFNRRGAGKYRSKGKRKSDEIINTENAHPAIIPRDMFQRIQQRLSRRISKYERQEPLPWDGLVYCACGQRCYRVSSTSRNGSIHHYYHCPAAIRYGSCKLSARLPAREVEKAVNEKLSADFSREAFDGLDIGKRFAELILPDIQRFFSDSSAVRQKLQAEIAKLEKQQETVYSDRLEGKVPEALAIRKVQELQERINAAREELAQIKTGHTEADVQNILDWLDGQVIADDSAFHAFFEREFARLFVARISLDGRSVAIEWTDFATCLQETPGRRGASAPAATSWGTACGARSV
jgi:DNA invertase Pin-like site-specific DNA recombinase